MIFLDSNFLIRAIVEHSQEKKCIEQWIESEEQLITSTVCWYEFICGPVNKEGIEIIASLIDERIIPYTRDHAELTARLFNATGRKRRLRVDAMIASSAIISGAALATSNTSNFKEFVKHGLSFAPC